MIQLSLQRRYDDFGIERPSVTGTMIPRIHMPGQESPLSTLSSLPVPRIPRVEIPGQTHQLERDDGVPPVPPPKNGRKSQGTVRTRRTRISEAPTQRSTLIVDPGANEAALFRMALFRNPSIGYQRCIFFMQKYPALVLMMVSSWVLWGRGFEQARHGNEGTASVVAFIAGAFILGSVLFASLDHNFSYTRAKIMTNVRHMCVLIGGVAAVAVIILAASSIHPLDQQRKKDPVNPKNSTMFVIQDRLNNQAILVGASALIVALSVCALVFGCAGLFQMEKRLEEEKRRRRNTTAYDNPTMQF